MTTQSKVYKNNYANILHAFYTLNVMTISKIHKIKVLLKEKKLTYEQFAVKIGTTRQTINNIFNGRSKIDIDTIEVIANVLNVPVSYFFEEDQGNAKKIIGDNNVIGHENTNNSHVGNMAELADKNKIIENLEKVNNFYNELTSSLFSDISDLYVDLIEKAPETADLLKNHKTTTRLLARLNTISVFSEEKVKVNARFYGYFEG